VYNHKLGSVYGLACALMFTLVFIPVKKLKDILSPYQILYGQCFWMIIITYCIVKYKNLSLKIRTLENGSESLFFLTIFRCVVGTI